MDYQFQGDLAEGMWLDDPNLEMFMRAVSLSPLFLCEISVVKKPSNVKSFTCPSDYTTKSEMLYTHGHMTQFLRYIDWI
jgi:hypothetical protein